MSGDAIVETATELDPVAAPSRQQPRVAVILGTNYCGSHLFSHLLSAHPDCLGVGELHRFHDLVHNTLDAPVVSDYHEQVIYKGLEDSPIEQWHAMLWTRARDAGMPISAIVDNSKKVAWVKRIEGNPTYDIRLMHLLRDPRAMVLRWLNTYDTGSRRRVQRIRVARRVPGRAAHILLGNWVTVFTYKWLRENQQITRYLAQCRHAHTVVTYHDMVFDTAATLSRVMPLMDLDFDPQQLRFGEVAAFGTVKQAHADRLQRSAIEPDLKWQRELEEVAVAQIVGNRDVQRYLDSLGLSFGDNGLLVHP